MIRNRTSSVKLQLEELEDRSVPSAIPITQAGDWQWEASPGGGMIDMSTGLVWSQNFYDKLNFNQTWDYANNYANELVEDGFDDWRLPTAAELQAAVSHDLNNHVTAWSNGDVGTRKSLWSSTRGQGQGHLLVSLWDGSTHAAMDGSGMNGIAVRGPVVVPARTTPNVRVFTQQLYDLEGVVNRVRVALDTKPTANVTIPISSSEPSVATVSVSQLVFTPTNWNIPQSFDVTAIDDTVYDPNHPVTINLGPAQSTDANYSGRSVPSVALTVWDNEKAVTLVPDAAVGYAVTDENGATASLWLSLTAQPAPGTTVEVNPGSVVVTSGLNFNTAEGVILPGAGTVFNANNNVDFDATNWNTPRQILVRGVADNLQDGDVRHVVRPGVVSSTDPKFDPTNAALIEFGQSGLLIGNSRLVTNVDVNSPVQQSASGTINLAIPDATKFSSGTLSSSLNIPLSGTVGDVNLTLNVNHADLNQLKITLTAPDGTVEGIFGINEVSGTALTNTTLDDEAPTPWAQRSSPYTGSFSFLRLYHLDGHAANGNWKLTLTDTVRGGTGTLVGWSLSVKTVGAGSPLLAAALPDQPLAAESSLTPAQLQPILQEAIRRWESTSLSETQIESLRNMTVTIANLGGAYLGLQNPGGIWIDDNAAGWGWFVDPTPEDDSEFTAPGNQGEQGRIDLLTVLMHEIGHLLGADHDEGGVMAETLSEGARRLPACDVESDAANVGLFSVDLSEIATWRNRLEAKWHRPG